MVPARARMLRLLTTAATVGTLGVGRHKVNASLGRFMVIDKRKNVAPLASLFALVGLSP